MITPLRFLFCFFVFLRTKNAFIATSSRNKVPLKGGWALPERHSEEFGDSGDAESRGATPTTPPHQEEPIEVVTSCVRCSSWEYPIVRRSLERLFQLAGLRTT